MDSRRLQRRCGEFGRDVAGLVAVALAALAVGALAVGATPAAADDRYVAPGGLATACVETFPCAFDVGVNEAMPGDVVHVSGDAGPYTIDSPIIANLGVTVVGEGASAPSAVLEGSGGLVIYPTASIRRFDLSRTNVGLTLHLAGTGSELRVEAAEGIGVEVSGLLRDSFVHSTASMTPAVQVLGDTAKIRNVTAVADGADSIGIRAPSLSSGFPEDCLVVSVGELRNVIARGAGADLVASTNDPECPAVLDTGFSNYRGGSVVLEGLGAAVVDQGGNQTAAEPLLAADGFHQLPGSPTVDAGAATPENGPADVDGEARMQGSAPDIGADEFLVFVAPPTPDTVAPVGSKLAFRPRVFRPRAGKPGRAGASARKRGGRKRRRTRRTSRVGYRLSEAARVRFFVQRRVIGRVRGKRCVVGKRARRLRKARKCRRFVRRKGGFVRSGAAGANRFRFDGYLGGRRLKPGVYRMVAVPTDAAGNRGGRFRASFAIARG